MRPGIDVLLLDSAHLVAGRSVGLLTNQTGVDRNGLHDLDRLVQAGVRVAAVFSPEHGFRGTLDQENIGHGVDSATGLPIFSLYGETRAPTAEMLRGVDILVVDLQDIGARPYTYVSTTLLALGAAARHGVPVIVLDRPNPIGGVLVQGPILDRDYASFVGMMPIPLRHGMTLGELATLGNDRLQLGAELTVVPAAGWARDRWFDATGLPWIRPSPNMPSLESATHYPGLVLFEATNLSVGRGTDVAFQVVAAPWLAPSRVRPRLPDLPGVAVADTTVTPEAPSDGKYPGEALPALRFRATDRAAYDPVRTAVAVLAALREAHPADLRLDAARFDQLAGSDLLRSAIEGGQAIEEITAGWRAAHDRFARVRTPYLLYR